MEAAEFQTLKRNALIRRSTMLISWLHRPQYALYEGHESTTQLIKLIDLVIWALERSIPQEEWIEIWQSFLDARFVLNDIFETEEAEKSTYLTALSEVEEALSIYREHIQG